MAKRRGFLAELQYQGQQAEKRKRQQQVAAARFQLAAQHEAERRQRELERLHVAVERASVAERARLEREAAEAYVQSRLAEVEARNAKLANVYQEIDGLLAATMGVDDYVDLEAMKTAQVQHPRFDPGPLATPSPLLPALVYPPQPVYQEPPAPTGLGSAFGGRKKHEEATARARADFDAAQRQWHAYATRMHADYVTATQRRDTAEEERTRKLAAAQAVYMKECRDREEQAAERNAALNTLINELAFDVESAINEYVDIVLSNSVYPESFPASYDHEFNLHTRELTLTVHISAPSMLPAVKEYRYVRVTDEITATPLTAKAQKDRYASAVWQVAVRTIHEVFEADRSRKIRTIALTVATRGINPATGLEQPVPLVIAAADRDTFSQFDLTNVVPHATLAHLGAALSKSPFDLVPADGTRGVRARGR